MRIICCIVLLIAAAASAEPALLPGDRVLFLGDDLTQQMFFTRAAATCLMPLQPAGELRFFNGGREGATAGEAVEWSGPLIERTRPTVVVICFGLADAVTHEADQYEMELSNLIASVRGFEYVHRVIVVSPPALPKETGPRIAAFADVAERVAKTERATFIDIYRPMAELYAKTDHELMKHLTLGDRLPGEAMHMVIASYLLQGMGVSGEQAAAVGWSPLPPAQMGEVRPHLAWSDTPASELETAAASRRLYLMLTACDELFFRMWRLEQSSDDGLDRQLAESWLAAQRQAAIISSPTP